MDAQFDPYQWPWDEASWEFVETWNQNSVDPLLVNGQQSPTPLNHTHEPSQENNVQTEPNDLFEGWDILDPDYLVIDEILSRDPGYGAPSMGHDLPLQPPAISPPMQKMAPEIVERVNLGAPLPPRNNPSPDVLSIIPPDWLDRERIVRDSADVQCRLYGVGHPLQEEVISETTYSKVDTRTSTMKGAWCGEVQSHSQPKTETSTVASRCAPCRFAGVPKSQCDGSIGSVCTRCRHLKSKVDKETNKRAKDWLNTEKGAPLCMTEFLVEPLESLSLPKVIYFELIETQLLLADLRQEVEELSSLRPGDSLESLFNGHLVCHIDDKECYSPSSTTSSAVAIKRLATTTSEAAVQAAGIVPPALDAVQLDTFVDQRRPARETTGLAEVDRETLTIAWRCAYWITMLLNWDDNEIYLNPASPRAIALSDAKNLILELTYSVAHRIQELIKKLCHRVINSMSSANDRCNPIAICCALWIVFSATHKFERRNFKAKSLENLRNFLTKLHARSRAAFHSINQYKWMIGAHCCGHARDSQGVFVKLIADAKSPRSVVSFAFERHVDEGFMFLQGNDMLNSGLAPQSYSQVLESKVSFLEDDELFSGRAGRNLSAPRPSDRTWRARPVRTVASPSLCSTITAMPQTKRPLSALNTANDPEILHEGPGHPSKHLRMSSPSFFDPSVSGLVHTRSWTTSR